MQLNCKFSVISNTDGTYPVIFAAYVSTSHDVLAIDNYPVFLILIIFGTHQSSVR